MMTPPHTRRSWARLAEAWREYWLSRAEIRVRKALAGAYYSTKHLPETNKAIQRALHAMRIEVSERDARRARA